MPSVVFAYPGAAMRSASVLIPCARMRCDFGQSNGAVALNDPITGRFTTTSRVSPARHRVRASLPPPASVSAAVMARPSSVRGSNENALPPAPSRTSPTASTPSAGEPASTAVMATCRASLVTSVSQNIQPRAPVGPRFQSFLALAGIASPWVKSGIAIFPPPAANADEPAMESIAQERVIQTCFMMPGRMPEIRVEGGGCMGQLPFISRRFASAKARPINAKVFAQPR